MKGTLTNGAVETQNGAEEGLQTSSRKFASLREERDPDPDLH